MTIPLVDAGGARIPQLGLGTWELRGAVCARLVEQALRAGYRHIDTAHVYGNEAEVGDGLRASRIARDDIFVSTKVWWTNLAKGDLERAAAQSVKRLGFAPDLLLVHWPNPAIPLAETIEALNEARRRGLTRFIGVSNFTVGMIEEAVKHSEALLVTNQIELHPYLDQSKIIASCRKHGLAVTAYSPIGSGALRGDALIGAIGLEHGKTTVQVCLRYLIQQGIIVIPRTSKLEHLHENIAVFDFELTESEMQNIAALAGRNAREISPSWAPEWD